MVMIIIRILFVAIAVSVVMFMEWESIKRKERQEAVVDLILQYGSTDGAHHKQWLLDQILRLLLEKKYLETIQKRVYPGDGEVYSWDEGIAP